MKLKYSKEYLKPTDKIIESYKLEENYLIKKLEQLKDRDWSSKKFYGKATPVKTDD